MIFGTLPGDIAERYFWGLDCASRRNAWQFDARRGVGGVWDCNGIHVDDRVMRDLAGDITTLATAEEYLRKAEYGPPRPLRYSISTTEGWGWFHISLPSPNDHRITEAALMMARAIERWLEGA